MNLFIFISSENENSTDSSRRLSEERIQKSNKPSENLSLLNQIDKPLIAETNPKEFANILRKKLENLGNKSKIYKRDSSDTEAERMIGNSFYTL